MTDTDGPDRVVPSRSAEELGRTERAVMTELDPGARAMVVATVVVVVVLGQGGVSHPCGRAPWLAGAIGKKAPRNQRRKYSTARAAKARASAG